MEGFPMQNAESKSNEVSITHEFIDGGNILEVNINEFSLKFYRTAEGIVRLKDKSNLSKRIGITRVPDYIFNQAKERARIVFKDSNPNQYELSLENQAFSKEDAQRELNKIKELLNE